VYYGFIVTITSPLSRCSTHVVSSDPFVAPKIDLGLLSDPIDVALLAAGFDSANEVFSSRHFSGQKPNRVIPSPEIDLKDREQVVSLFETGKQPSIICWEHVPWALLWMND
jgi:hypothetical protein